MPPTTPPSVRSLRGRRHVLHQLVSQFGNRQRLQPDPARTGQGGEKDAVSAEDHVLDSRDPGDLKSNAGLEGSHVPRVHAQRLSRGQILDHQLPRQLDPASALPGHLLQQESVSAEDPGAQGLLEANPELDLRGGAEKAVAVDQILHSGADLDRLDVPRDTGGKGNLAPGAHGAVFGHEQASSARHSFQRAEESSSPAKLGVGLHLDRAAHPGELSGF